VLHRGECRGWKCNSILVGVPADVKFLLRFGRRGAFGDCNAVLFMLLLINNWMIGAFS
tara:strand:- start:1449 stop:1622 length:174 start_codon:yes stop_codon:yes gene_type:complete